MAVLPSEADIRQIARFGLQVSDMARPLRGGIPKPGNRR